MLARNMDTVAGTLLTLKFQLWELGATLHPAQPAVGVVLSTIGGPKYIVLDKICPLGHPRHYDEDYMCGKVQKAGEHNSTRERRWKKGKGYRDRCRFRFT